MQGQEVKKPDGKGLHLCNVRAVIRSAPRAAATPLPTEDYTLADVTTAQDPPADDGWRDEPLCSIDASPGPESGLLAAAAPSADTPRGPVPGQPSVTPATTPTLPWTPDQAGPATVLQKVVNQGPPVLAAAANRVLHRARTSKGPGPRHPPRGPLR